MTDPRAAAKEAAGRYAARFVETGMRVGLGTGSTVKFTIQALAEAGLDLVCTSTSGQTSELATRLGLKVVAPDELRRLDIAIDGADEVDPSLNLIKGGGGALTREKLVAQMSDRFVVVVDETKLVDVLGEFGTPYEVLAFAPEVVADRVRALGAADVSTRRQRSDNGNLLADARFGPTIVDPAGLSAALDAIPGIIEHGIFLGDIVERVVVAADGGVRELSH